MNENRFAKPNYLYKPIQRNRSRIDPAEFNISKTPTNMIKVSNLPNTPVTIKDIKKVFSCYGEIRVIDLDFVNWGRVGNFALITYHFHNDAMGAFKDVNFDHDVEIDDFVLKVDYLKVPECGLSLKSRKGLGREKDELSREKLGYSEDPRDCIGLQVRELGDCATDDEN